ncbi:hypothetical protein [Kribbella sindirgiensis]|uniref:Uncharacterized protein n=1 Tax=Kribbella sindirgiensis TaxID=1124744 RepID=A0A4R0IRC2_9ACTN|nr:hypothetical protein [Kribbella sindirgiensis]TCC34944.1 hypothetical protein E0H50_13720 [Kribbella sindirgiensis]
MTDETVNRGAGGAIQSAAKSLSQLAAKILEQLSISAWLPSAALALLTLFVMELGAVLDGSSSDLEGRQPSLDPGVAIPLALRAMGNTSLGGLVLLVMAVVVLTMLTQAFAFESIRLLEGYWGVSRPLEWLADARAERWRKHHKHLAKRHARFTKAAWKRAKRQIAAREDFTREMIAVLQVQILGSRSAAGSELSNRQESRLELTDEEQSRVDELDWRLLAPGELLRRRVNLELKLDDFPVHRNIMPTRLGNVLRRYEDETRRQTVESLVDQVFDSLPPSLRSSHDEQRGRLDLYCTMYLVLMLAGVIAVLRFIPVHWGYSVAAVGITALSVWTVYRAAVASARYYGSLLVTIANYDDRHGAATDEAQP